MSILNRTKPKWTIEDIKVNSQVSKRCYYRDGKLNKTRYYIINKEDRIPTFEQKDMIGELTGSLNLINNQFQYATSLKPTFHTVLFPLVKKLHKALNPQ